jgi:hypothetical protein
VWIEREGNLFDPLKYIHIKPSTYHTENRSGVALFRVKTKSGLGIRSVP